MNREKRKKLSGKTKCCEVEPQEVGGGYIGEDIEPIYSVCPKCGKSEPEIYPKLGRPIRLPF